MSDNIFIDTNVLIYCYTVDEPAKKEKALSVVYNSSSFISTQVLTELSNILYKKFNLEWHVVKNVLIEISAGFNIYIINPETIKKACYIADRYKYSFYDSLIVSAALSCSCNILYSEDMQDEHIIEDSLKIINPFK